MPHPWPLQNQPPGRAVLLFPAPPEQWRAPESVLGLLIDEQPAPGGLHPRFSDSGVFNGPVYAMRRLRTEPWLRIDCRTGWYFDSLNSCERLELEGRFRRSPPSARRSLDGSGRTAAIGISTVVTWREGGFWRALAAPMRARAMRERAGLLHVVPSGMFAPPYSVIENVRRELMEELGVVLDPHRLRLTGVAWNALNQRPEICTALLLRCRPSGRLNGEEFAPRRIEVELRAGLAPEALPGFFAPGAGAIALAARLLGLAGFASD